MESSQLELEFRALVSSIGKQIDSKIDAAAQYLREATALSEKYGIPFRTSVSPIPQAYIPYSYKERFGSLNRQVVDEVLEIDPHSLSYGGWERSAIC